MAWAERIPSSGRYRGRYRDAAGRVQTLDGPTFGRKSEAKNAAAVAEEEARRRPGQRNAKAGRATWVGWVDVWWPQRRGIQPGTLARDENRRRLHLDDHWGPRRLDRITRDDVQDWVDELSHDAGLAPRSVANCYHILSASLKDAVIDGRISYTPCVGIELPPPDPPDERYLTPDEVKKLFHYLDDRDKLIAWTLVGTGMRWGELAGLHAHRVHLDHKRVDLLDTWDDRMGHVKPHTKDHQKRAVPLPGWLVEMLGDQHAAAAEVFGCSAPHRASGRRAPKCRSGLVFPAPDGGALKYSTWRRGPWDRAVRLAGIGPCTIHDLRHTFASWLVQSGVPLEVIRDLLGHSTIKVTERYAHLRKAHWDGVREVLGEVVAPLLPQHDLQPVDAKIGP